MDIVHYKEKGFYIFGENQEVLAELNYEKKDNILIADHTQVSESLKGQGIAGKLFDELVKYARKNKYKINPVCSYVEKKMKKSNYDDLKI